MERWQKLAVIVALCSAPQAAAQTIQLPSYSTFSIDTSVVVPDSGPGPLARDRRASTSAMSAYGIGPARAIGVQRAASGASVVGQIHDPQEAEAALKANRGANGAGSVGAAPRQSPLAPKATNAGLQSVKSLEQQHNAKQASKDREAESMIARAKAAEAEGKTSLAITYLRTAAGEASPALKAAIDRDIARLRAATQKAAPQAPTKSNGPKKF